MTTPGGPRRVRRGTIVTLGGGGFSMSHDGTSPIDDHLCALTGVERPRVCFVPTASGDDAGYAERFEAAFAGRATTSVLSLFGKGDAGYVDPQLLLTQHIVYVGGGSTANLLAVWRCHGLPDILRLAVERGTLLVGISAGMNCWFDQSSTDSFGPLAPLRDGLGFLPGSACPHYDGEADRRAAYLRWVEGDLLDGGWAVRDHTALVWRDGVMVEAIGERSSAAAFHVERTSDGVTERAVPVRLLDGVDARDRAGISLGAEAGAP